MHLRKLGLNTRTLNALARKNIFTTNDIVLWMPREYRDYRYFTDLEQTEPGGYYAVKGTLTKAEKKYGKRPYIVMRIRQANGTGVTVMHFVRTNLFPEYERGIGRQFAVCGKVNLDPVYGYSINNPDICVLKTEFRPNIKKIYPSIKGVSDKMFLEILNRCLEIAFEPFDKELMDKMKIPVYQNALTSIHYPVDYPLEVEKARDRIMLNDMVYFALAMKRNDAHVPTDSLLHFPKRELTDSFMASLPFTLTDDQKNVVDRIIDNANSDRRNNILLQGDVGCGKTIVAVLSMICAYENGYQSVLMAPREVLAAQHYNEISGYARTLGIQTAFLHSGMKQKEKREIFEKIASGEISFVIGTHSCISDAVQYKNLGLIVTDEEHLFGVAQKEALEKKAMAGVHNISMSATPIPRTMAAVVYGEKKEICIIHTMPKGRLPIQTCTQRTRGATLRFMEKQIAMGHQCYVVCPAIEDNENIELISIEAVENGYRSYFEPKGIKVGVVNGKMSKEEIDETIKGFVANEIQILLSTTVIEVGVNVPNSTLMVVEQADRFGLASLHQLRGRVGRSSFQSYCILLSDRPSERLDIMVQTTDGFKIAEADLKIRGSGDLIGYRQAGNNRYIQEMLQNPDMYRDASRIADYCVRHDLGHKLLKLYAEHELLASGVDEK